MTRNASKSPIEPEALKLKRDNAGCTPASNELAELRDAIFRGLISTTTNVVLGGMYCSVQKVPRHRSNEARVIYLFVDINSIAFEVTPVACDTLVSRFLPIFTTPSIFGPVRAATLVVSRQLTQTGIFIAEISIWVTGKS